MLSKYFYCTGYCSRLEEVNVTRSLFEVFYCRSLHSLREGGVAGARDANPEFKVEVKIIGSPRLRDPLPPCFLVFSLLDYGYSPVNTLCTLVHRAYIVLTVIAQNKTKMTATMGSGTAAVLLALVAALSSNHQCHAFYLPGVNPQSFAEGEA